MNIAFYTVCGVLMILGAAEIIRIITLGFTCRPFGKTPVALVVSPKSAEDCEMVLRRAVQGLKWGELLPDARLICIYNGDKEIEKICSAFMRSYGFLTLCRPEELVYNIINTAHTPGFDMADANCNLSGKR